MHPIRTDAADVAVIALYFVSTLAIGVLFREKGASTSSFFHAGKKLPLAITTIAFISANCGALEIVGMVSTTAKYGALALHFYWIGAIPAILFLALFMMPIYIRSKALTVPEFLELRYNEPTRILNAIAFAIVMLLISGISLYAMAEVLRVFVGWSFNRTVFTAGLFVLLYVSLGGLIATMYNEAFQFFFTVAGLLPLVWIILRKFHGLQGLLGTLPPRMTHLWDMPIRSPSGNPMDVVGVIMGLGFVLSFGYWCTDFVLMQRAIATRNIRDAINTPLLASVVKLLFPVLIVIPGLAAASIFRAGPAVNYDQALPALMQRYYGHGLLGIGVTVILASLMSALAGNVTAFSTVVTHDLYRKILAPSRLDRHYIIVGRILMCLAILSSIATAYIALRFNDLMDYLQLLFSLFSAPLFATFLLGMFTTWTTPKAGFWGLLAGILASAAHNWAFHMRWLHYGSDMSANFYGAILAFSVCLAITAMISFFTARKPISDLAGLTYQTRNRKIDAVPAQSYLLAFAIALVCLLLNFVFR
jgi:SSS family solute:Na+ symporter